jgi:hypothetical protein
VEAPAFMRGRSALALRERVSTLVTRFSAGKAKASFLQSLLEDVEEFTIRGLSFWKIGRR